MSDLYVDADGLAAVADQLGSAAADISSARDDINSGWNLAPGAFGSSPAITAFDDCCQVWVAGTNAIAQLANWVAVYTQDIATSLGAADKTLAQQATQMYSKSDLPTKDEKQHGMPNTGPVA